MRRIASLRARSRAWAITSLAVAALLFPPDVARAQSGPPMLLWERGACFSSWCETGWYGSPAAVDLEGDGTVEIIASSYSVVVLEGATGALRWRVASGHDITEPGAPNVGRTWPGIIVADVNDDGALEIVTGHGGGIVSVYDITGRFLPGWPWENPNGGEVRSLCAGDLDGNGDLEILAGRAGGGTINLWALEHTGTVRQGWPQVVNQPGFTWGIYNANVAIGDMMGDSRPEIIAPSDVHYICAYNGSGVGLPCNPLYTNRTTWGQVGAYTSFAYELQGFGPCDSQYTTRGNFASGAATLADMDGDGTVEVIVVGNVHDCHTNPYTDVYMGPYIFNADRTRFNNGTHEWGTVPINTGAPLSQDFSQIENIQQNAVAADLDGDGQKEFLFPSYDGRLHCFWLDKTEHGSWPFEFLVGGEGIIRFGSEPAVADLDGDGTGEVIVASWTEKGSNQSGHLFIINADGTQRYAVPLPAAFGGDSWNGALACPTLANIDDDADLEVVLATAHAGFVAYKLPGTAGARVLWGTGRGSVMRGGVAAVVAPAVAAPGVVVH